MVGAEILTAPGDPGRPLRRPGAFRASTCGGSARRAPASPVDLHGPDVLAEGEERIDDWRERLRDALGINGGLIAGIIPELEILLGKQPPVPELPLAEAKRRFQLVFRVFLGVFAREGHPLTLFLDDLQWADAASLELLAELLAHPETRHLLFIGAYRDNEVTAAHPLMAMVAGLRGAGVAVHDLVLAPLSRGDLGQFVADAMRRPPGAIRELADLVAEKTGGNPFFAIQFLTSLQHDGLIRFNPEALAWRCDVAAARARGYTDNVVDMMVAKLQQLAPAAQEAARLAACVGNVVAVDTLAMLRDQAAADAHQELWPLAREGLLDRSGDRYRFSHDRVQQAAYALIPEDRRAATHLRIGQLLLAHTPAEELGDAVFDIVNQLDLGASLMSSRGERTKAAELNLLAARRAKASAAYAGAARYVTRAISLLDEGAWDLDYALAYGLHLELAQLEYLLGDRGRAQEVVAELLARARDDLDRATVYEFLVDLHTTEGDNEKAVETALRCIALFGIHLIPHPSHEEVQREYDELWRNLGDREIEELIALPAMTDRRTQAALGALAAPTVAAMFTDLNLLLQLSCQMVNLCLRHGNTDASVVGYVWLGITLGPVFGKYADGYRFGKLAYDYVQEHRLVALKPRIDICFGDLINFWTRPLQTDLAYLQEGFRAAVELGDLTYACYCANHIVTVMIVQGSPLEAVYRESEVRLDFVRKARYAPVVDEIISMQRFIQNMRGLTASFSTFDDSTFDQRAFEEHLRREVRPLTVCWYYILKLTARFMSGDHAEALEAAERARALLWSTPGHMQVPEYHYYRALALAAAHAGASPEEQRDYAEALREHEAQFREWAENCPENFASKSALVSAELARITGADLRAMRLYERAIRSASDNGLTQNEAIAYELAAAFYRARGFAAFSDVYLRNAWTCYRRWGADGKVRQLERLHPDLFGTWPPAPTATIAVRSEQLDLLSVLKASQTLSSEIEIEKLVGTLLQVVVEQGGARRGCLVLERDGALFVEAEASMEETGMATRILPSLPMESSELVPASVVHLARQTRQPVIVEDVTAGDQAYASDAYFSRRRTRSVLCLPILRQAQLIGLLYLENRYIAGAFTPDRLTALSLLASQAAISMENARWLREERQGRRRSAFLAEAGALLSESLDYEETLSRLGRLCVQSLADWCVLDLLHGREIRRLAGACADPAKEPLLEKLRQRHPARWDSPHPAAATLRSGEPVLIPDVSDEFLRSHSEDEDHFELVRAIGTRSLVTVPLLARGQPLGVFTMASGTPGRYGWADLELAQEVARRAASAIDNARLYREVQRTDQRKSEFIAVLSHELRNPLAPIRTGLQLLRRSPPDSPIAAQAREIMERQTEHLSRLVNDLLDITRISHGRIELQRTRLDLREVVRATCDDLQSLFERGAVGLSVESTPEPIWIEADATRIVQVLGNLLQNAAKFTSAGGSVTVRVRAAGGRAEVSVRDTGVGIAAEVMQRIFEPFAQAEQGLARTQGGLGLGLALTKGLVELHDGSIHAMSEGPGRGAEFVVSLPLAA
jgi:predicted ATPase/signal transduction histidine kinase